MITTATILELNKALSLINKHYKDNIIFKNIEQISKNRVRFTLTVKDSRQSGGRVSPTGRIICAACWHVHGNFFDNLFQINNNVFVLSMGKRINKDKGNWIDSNIGSRAVSFNYSDACNCY